jgi:DNA-binding transcriptional LysR family regulator
MDPDEFRLFLEVAETGSFTRVAARRHTVQSHISRQVQALEKSLGGSLFHRTGRGVVLTELGRRVESRVRGWLRDTDELLTSIRADAGIPMGEVRLGLLPSAAHPLATRLYAKLKADYPRIRLDIREGQGGELDELLETGAVDMAILFRYQPPDGDGEHLLATAGTWLVSGPGDALTATPRIDFSALADLPLILPRRPAHWRAMLDETAHSKGFSLKAEIEADSLRLQKELATAHRGLYAVLGSFSIDAELRAGTLAASRIVNPDLQRHVTLAMARQGQLTAAGRVVAGLIRQLVAQWGGRLSPPDHDPSATPRRNRHPRP